MVSNRSEQGPPPDSTRSELSQNSFQARRVTVTLESAALSVSATRRAVEGLLEDQGSEEPEGRLKLIVSELLTNAVLHGAPGRQIHLDLPLYHRHAFVSVRNYGLAFDLRKFRSRRPTGGRGLDVVAELAHSWAIQTSSAGTIVSARVQREAPPGCPTG